MKAKLYISAIFIFLFSGYIANAQDALPEMNKKIIEFVTKNIGKKVDRGECWDLANQALILVDAKWDHEYKYGKRLDPKKDEILPGDIMQFEKVKVKYVVVNGDETTTTIEDMGHHTAVIYRVIEPGVFELAHQNTSFSGRKVGLSKLELKNITKGKYFIYRPTK